MRTTKSILSSSADLDDAVRQLDADLTAVLHRHAPLHKRMKRPSKHDIRWLSPEAIAAKQMRCRMEGWFARTKSPDVKSAYRQACRAAHRLIIESRASHIRDEVSSVADNPRLLWKTVRRLLHSASSEAWYEGCDTTVLAYGISDFFIRKLLSVRTKVENGLRSLRRPTLTVPYTKPTSTLLTLAPVTPAEMERLIQYAPSKTSQQDVIPIALMKHCAPELSVIVTQIANLSFKLG